MSKRENESSKEYSTKKKKKHIRNEGSKKDLERRVNQIKGTQNTNEVLLKVEILDYKKEG